VSCLRRFLLLLEKKKEEMQRRDDKKKRTQKKGRNSPARVKTPRARTPFVRLFIHSSAIGLFFLSVGETKNALVDTNLRTSFFFLLRS